jgi:hypothetical protein
MDKNTQGWAKLDLQGFKEKREELWLHMHVNVRRAGRASSKNL